MRNSVARLGTRYQLFFGSDPRSLGCNSDGDTRVAKRDIARRILPGLQQLERHALRYALEQPSAVAEEHRAHDELILIDETVLRQLRHDRSATEDHHVLAGPLLHGRDLVHVQLTDEASVVPRHFFQCSGENELGRLVHPDGDHSVLSRLLPWTVRIRRRAGVLQGLPPESFEEFVGPAPEEHGVGSRHARRGGLGLLVVGHDPVQVAVGTREVAIGGEPVEGEDAARGSHT